MFPEGCIVDPHDSNALMNMAVLYSIRGEIEKAEKLFAEAIEITPTHPTCSSTTDSICRNVESSKRLSRIQEMP